jgi:hypothetical protein
LLNEDGSAWDVDVVRSVFEGRVAEQVLQIPISRRVGEDFISWPYTKFGDYTVRSGYNLARTEKFYTQRSKKGGGVNSAVQDTSLLWRKLWAIKAPGKMKINFWRFAHDCLPSGVQLTRRHIPTSPLCVYCNREETAAHTFLFCQFAQEVWREIKPAYGIHLHRKLFTDPKSWVFDTLAASTDIEWMVVVVTFWHLCGWLEMELKTVIQ